MRRHQTIKIGSTAPFLDVQNMALTYIYLRSVGCPVTHEHHLSLLSLSHARQAWMASSRASAMALRMGMMSTVIFTKPSPYYSALGGPSHGGSTASPQERRPLPTLLRAIFRRKYRRRLPGRRRTTQRAPLCLPRHTSRCNRIIATTYHCYIIAKGPSASCVAHLPMLT